ncbi:MAG: FecR domain-containing protein [Caulobacteraceae bacterium]
MSAHNSDPKQLASFWDARLRSPLCSDEDRAAFTTWRNADPANAAAFQHLQAGIDALHEAYSASAELRSFRDAAIRAGQRLQRRRLAVAASIVLVGSVSVAAWRLGLPSALFKHAPPPVAEAAPSIFETAVGVRSSVVLPDGSKVTLNTRSRIEASFTGEKRSIKLLSGEALFEVAKDKARPFEVVVGGRRIVAVGTAFDVRLDSKRVELTMIEGRVGVASVASPAPRPDGTSGLQVAAGQRLIADLRSDSVWTEKVDPEAVGLWRQGKVEFANTPLADAVAEMNRYSSIAIVVEDQSLAALPISGMFFTAKPENFITALSTYFPIQAETGDHRIVLRRRAQEPGRGGA